MTDSFNKTPFPDSDEPSLSQGTRDTDPSALILRQRIDWMVSHADPVGLAKAREEVRKRLEDTRRICREKRNRENPDEV